MIEDLFDLIPPDLLAEPGHVFHSSRAALKARGGLYILGLNPAGDPSQALAKGLTIGHQICEVLSRQDGYSEYLDHEWDGRQAGAAPIQVRMTHLAMKLGLDMRSVPAGNLIFYCTKSDAALSLRKVEFLERCWPFHKALIERCRIRCVICMGQTAGKMVRHKLGAHELVDQFTELNSRRWKSHAHVNGDGVHVFTLTHPARADWRAPASDPSSMVLRWLTPHR